MKLEVFKSKNINWQITNHGSCVCYVMSHLTYKFYLVAKGLPKCVLSHMALCRKAGYQIQGAIEFTIRYTII